MEMLGQLHENKPIAEVAIFHDIRQVLLCVTLSTVVSFVFPKRRRNNGNESEKHMECGPSGQGEKPEPQENVDFLVDDVDGQNAQVISSLHGTGRTIFVKSTFGHLREYLGHGIDTFFNGQFASPQNIEAILGKLAVQEKVHKINLEQNVEEIEDFASNKFGDITVVRVHGPDKVLNIGTAFGFFALGLK